MNFEKNDLVQIEKMSKGIQTLNNKLELAVEEYFDIVIQITEGKKLPLKILLSTADYACISSVVRNELVTIISRRIEYGKDTLGRYIKTLDNE